MSSLSLTHATGVPGDTSFNDAFTIGKYPGNLVIERIHSIEIFATDAVADDNSYISGLKIEYNTGGSTTIATHGVVTDRRSLGTLTLAANKSLVGVFGRLKASGTHNGSRLHSIGLAVFDKDDATLNGEWVKEATTGNPGRRWATFGKVLAFQGTTTGAAGPLSSLGFVKEGGLYSENAGGAA